MAPPSELTKARLADLRSLHDKRVRQETGRYLVEGFHVVEEALAAGATVEELLLGDGAAKSPAGLRVAEAARAAKARVTEVPRKVLEKVADADSPQGVVAVVRAARPEPAPPLDRDGVHVILDGIQDPGNAGAILRAADAFGCASVVFCRGTVEALNPKVLRAAQGSHFHLPVATGPAAPEAVAAARAAGHRVLAAVAAGGEPLWSAAPPGRRVSLVLGNEARGSAPETVKACHGRVTVPMRGRAESLGVAAAAAVVLAWFARPGGGA